MLVRKKILVGSIGKPYGINGWVKINSYTEPFTNLIDYRPWYLEAPGKRSSSILVGVKKCCLHGQQLLALFENSTTPESARFYTNYKIYVERDQFFPLHAGEYYWADLEGLKVYNRENIYLGIIQTIFATGANDVLVISDKKRYLVPFLFNQTIQSIDLKTKIMIVDWDANF
ncbi:16S rRNA processing protein RimM [Rickettsiella grylli]|nr:16S rRNA processing protein RimM [Rickettsiella grylli]